MSPVAAAPPARIETLKFADDGLVPNSALPVLIYRGAVAITDDDEDAAGEALDELVQRNDWHMSWTGTIYRKVHYHSTAHELLVVFNGTATIELGGRRFGEKVEVKGGDAVLIPAGVGHRRLESSGDFIVFGVYPVAGKDYDLRWDWEKERKPSLRRIAKVQLPLLDPLFGEQGPLLSQWGNHP